MGIKMTRNSLNPLISPKDVKPSRDNFVVEGTFNAGVTQYKEDTILLLRVAESVKSHDENQVAVPVLEKNDSSYSLTIKYFDKDNPENKYDFTDTRSLSIDEEGIKKTSYLTSLSHFRLARSKDGMHFDVDEKPFIFPDSKYETWGIEDPRITLIDGTYYINYTAVSELGAATALIKTDDFVSYERMGIIFPPENKDVTIFPEKINGLYYAYHRPVPKAIGDPNIWVSTSADLLTWGGHEHLLSVSKEKTWESGRIGGGAPSFKTEIGWIHIYHAADMNDRYCLGAFMTELEDPSKIIAKTLEPILVPTESYELEGFFGNVVFTCGVLVVGDIVKIYYGAADEVMALAETTITELYKALKVQ